MRRLPLPLFPFVSRFAVPCVALVALAACNHGRPAGTHAATSCTGSARNAVCLDGCSLGCHANTCDVTDIAQNEHIVLRFSQPMDPRSINVNTVLLRTATGVLPVGDFLVNGAIVEFVPKVQAIGAQTFFGFAAGETYTMTLPGGPGEHNSCRSTAGDALDATTSCTLRVTRGVIDLNGVPPSARIVRPTDPLNVPRDALIQVGFNEMIDAIPFLQSSAGNRPVQFEVAHSVELGDGRRGCRSDYTVLAGHADVVLLPELPDGIGALLTFRPAQPLPGTTCLRVTVSDQVHDLSGRPADVQTFELRTEVAPTVETAITEGFADDSHLDADVSAGEWGGGRGRFASIGGDGRHGSFDLADSALLQRLLAAGTLVRLSPEGATPTILRIDVDHTVIPATSTLSGAPAIVTDGRYFLTELVVPGPVRLQFTGSRPPQFTVRGRIQIDGVIDVSGESLAWQPAFNVRPPSIGQTGGRGGIFAGGGGDGGRACSGLGPETLGGVPTGSENGRNGGNCRVDAAHAYAAQVAGTGGTGARMFPAHGRTMQLDYPVVPGAAIRFAMEAAAGGSGGGLAVPGGVGQCIQNNRVPPQPFMGPPSPGGAALPLFPVPAGARHSLHFLVGGAGGGGGASQPTFFLDLNRQPTQPSSLVWGAGLGGGGGGGAMALRAGKTLRVGASGRVLASGGSAASLFDTTPNALALTSPHWGVGGGGAGGSILLQCGEFAQILGEISVVGGQQGVLDRTATGAPGEAGGRVRIEGGAGAPGFVRFERAGASTAEVPNARPPLRADNVGNLDEVDARVAFQSTFYAAGRPLAPTYLRYEIAAIVDGVRVVFSDDSSIGIPARAGFGPLEAFWQAAHLDVDGAIDEPGLDQRPWRSLVGGPSGLDADARNAFRFQIVLDRSGGHAVELESVKVVVRG